MIDYLERERLPTLAGLSPLPVPGHLSTSSPRSARARRPARAGKLALDDPALLDHLRQTLVEALRINNPKWIGDPEAGEPEQG